MINNTCRLIGFHSQSFFLDELINVFYCTNISAKNLIAAVIVRNLCYLPVIITIYLTAPLFVVG